MRRLRLLLLAVLLVLSGLTLPACGRRVKYEATNLTLFDTLTTVVGYAESQAAFRRMADRIFTLLEDYHKSYDVYHDYEGRNNLKTLNDNAGVAPVSLKPEILDLLDFGREVNDLTAGAVNIAQGALLRLWSDFRAGVQAGDSVALPDDAALTEAAKHADWANVQVDRAAGTAYLADPAMSLDVGAIAKGYAVEQVALILEAEGVEGIVLNVGGNLRAIGAQPDGSPWQTSIQNPAKTTGNVLLGRVPLDGNSCVTSGAYHRYVTFEGVRYAHIIDPSTGYPADRFLSVSILTRHSGWADALSTALFCLSEEEGQALLCAYRKKTGSSAEALWVLSDETLRSSPGFPLTAS